jgi:hypothetical protein
VLAERRESSDMFREAESKGVGKGTMIRTRNRPRELVARKELRGLRRVADMVLLGENRGTGDMYR